jgi:hypothetical protein
MTKDKYNLFGRKKRAVVPRISLPLDIPKVKHAPKPKRVIEYFTPLPKVSRLEEPEDPQPEVVQPAVRPQLTGSYFAPQLPRIHSEPLRDLVVTPVIKKAPLLPPTRKSEYQTATSTEEFFYATKPLAAKPILRIPTPVLKEVVVVPEPLPGSREAKLRAFINTHF